jgi:hypothetical protein
MMKEISELDKGQEKRGRKGEGQEMSEKRKKKGK